MRRRGERKERENSFDRIQEIVGEKLEQLGADNGHITRDCVTSIISEQFSTFSKSLTSQISSSVASALQSAGINVHQGPVLIYNGEGGRGVDGGGRKDEYTLTEKNFHMSQKDLSSLLI